MSALGEERGEQKNSVIWLRLGGQSWEELSLKADYSASKLARVCKVSKRHLARKFQEQFGCSPKEWLREHRLEVARQRLARGKSLKEVAFELSFRQVSHFCRQFKQRYRETPGAFLTAQLRKKMEMSHPDNKWRV